MDLYIICRSKIVLLFLGLKILVICLFFILTIYDREEHSFIVLILMEVLSMRISIYCIFVNFLKSIMICVLFSISCGLF